MRRPRTELPADCAGRVLRESVHQLGRGGRTSRRLLRHPRRPGPRRSSPGPGAEFVKKYKEKYKNDPEAYAVYGYEAAKVVLEAIKKVGKKDREAILKARRWRRRTSTRGHWGSGASTTTATPRIQN